MASDIPSGPVDGTGDDDFIDKDYRDDPEGDKVDDGNENDTINAGAGNDTIVASDGNDTIDGGSGSDTYLATEFTSYTFSGDQVNGRAGESTSTIGDIDGDGKDDIIISARAQDGNDGTISNSGEVYVISSSDFAALDAADGDVDGYILLDNVKDAKNSYEIHGESVNDQLGWAVADVGDFDLDGTGDFMFGSHSNDEGGITAGAAYLVSGDDLAFLDGADGTVDGKISAGNVEQGAGSYKLYGTHNYARVGETLESAGDFDNDGKTDFIIGSSEVIQPGNVEYAAAPYLISSADLAAMDAANGTDGRIDLHFAAAQTNSYRFTGLDYGPGYNFEVNNVGDFDNDGHDDLIISDWRQDKDNPDDEFGAVYVISGADLTDIDGNADGIIDINDIQDGDNSFKLVGVQANSQTGTAISSAGDYNNDGFDDIIIGAPIADQFGFYNGEVYLISGTDLDEIDAADGTADGVIDLTYVDDQDAGKVGSYTFYGDSDLDIAGREISLAGDVDGDGYDDFLIGVKNGDGGANNAGETYLISGSEVAAMDADDGTVDGVIDLGNFDAGTTSYRFDGKFSADEAIQVSAAGDVDGDGYDDILISTPLAGNGSTSNFGETYLISGSELANLDAVDGSADQIIKLGNIHQDIGPDITATILNDGSGTISKYKPSTGTNQDTVTGVENYDGGVGGNDTISLTDTDTFGKYNASEVSGLSDDAVGTFTPDDGGAVINFGPSETLQFSDILALNEAGSVTITSGDQSGTVGNISFENFENISFDMICFTKGTMIETEKGEMEVEDIVPGCRVKTLDHGWQQVTWANAQKVSAAALAANPNLLPIRISAGALGNELPKRDLTVSPQHRMLVSSAIAEKMFDAKEVLVAAKQLLALPGVEIVEDCETVTYVHFTCSEHEVVFAEGAPSETLYTGAQALKGIDPEARAELFLIFPELNEDDYVATPVRPLIKTRLGRKLTSRHQKNGRPMLDQHYLS